MEQFLFNLLLFLTLFFVISQAAMLFLFLRSQSAHKKDHLGDPDLYGQSKLRSDQIIREAIFKANTIVAEAQKKGVKLLSTEENLGQKLSADYESHFRQVEELLKAQFSKSIEKAQSDYQEFIKNTETKINTHVDQHQKDLVTKADELIEFSRQQIAGITRDINLKMSSEMDKIINQTQKDLDVYREVRMRILDEYILNILEDVMRVALEKKLSFADQSELVFKALAQAKKENIIK